MGKILDWLRKHVATKHVSGNGIEVLSVRCFNISFDRIHFHTGHSYLQYGKDKKKFMVVTPSSKMLPPKIFFSAKWKIERSYGRYWFGTTEKPFEIEALLEENHALRTGKRLQ